MHGILYLCLLNAICSAQFGQQNDGAAEFAKCGEEWSDNNVKLCQCDYLCKHLNDCCRNGQIDNSTITSLEMKVGLEAIGLYETCVQLPGFKHPTSFVTSPIVKRIDIMQFNENCHKIDNTVAMEVLPVFDSFFNVNFRNLFCHHIYKDNYNIYHNYENPPTPWTIEIPSWCFEKVSSTLKDRIYLDLLSNVLSQTLCEIKLKAPQTANTRLCFNVSQRCEHCRYFQSPVRNKEGKLFKNSVCARCQEYGTTTNVVVGLSIEPSPSEAKETILTLAEMDSMYRPWSDPCTSSQNCHENCTEGTLFYNSECLQPVSKARGVLQRFAFTVPSNTTMYVNTESQTLQKFKIRVINSVVHSENILFKMEIKTRPGNKMASSMCLHECIAILYLEDNIAYSTFANLVSDIKRFMRNSSISADLKSEMMEMIMYENTTCEMAKGHNTGSASNRDLSKPDIVKFIIFGSIFGSFVFVVLVVTMVKMVIRTLTGAPPPNESPAETETGND